MDSHLLREWQGIRLLKRQLRMGFYHPSKLPHANGVGRVKESFTIIVRTTVQRIFSMIQFVYAGLVT